MYKPVIGLEIHAELKTKTKMFCDSLNDPDEKHPNVNVCPICMGHPGTLPVINEEAVRKVVLAGLALNCNIEKETFFERKNYFYPDLPKGYQISQYQKPLCYGGCLEIADRQLPTANGRKKVRITRVHLEEDTGRLYHLSEQTGDSKESSSLVDYNRAGVPLMELVTEPDFENGREIKEFASELQLIWQYLDVSEANMEKGEMRVEVNISLAEIDEAGGIKKMGTKVEIKNLNSIKFAADAVDYEIKRQEELLKNGNTVKQETRGWDEFKKQTFSQRSKEEAHDYRYFPEPDLPPIHLASKYIDQIKSQLPELPEQRRGRFMSQYQISEKDADLFTYNKDLGDYFEHVASELISFDKLDHLKKPEAQHQFKLLKLAANYIITELKRMADDIDASVSDTKITPDTFADLIVRIFHSEISSSGAQTVLKEMFSTGKGPGEIIKEKDLQQVSNVEELNIAAQKVIADNPKAVTDFKSGKDAPIKFLVGMAMKETKGRANPQIIEEVLRKLLK